VAPGAEYARQVGVSHATVSRYARAWQLFTDPTHARTLAFVDCLAKVSASAEQAEAVEAVARAVDRQAPAQRIEGPHRRFSPGPLGAGRSSRLAGCRRSGAGARRR
jgi:hypothetical protein